MQLLKQISYIFSTLLDTPRGTRLEEYISWKQPQNHADLERVIREYNQLKMW
jgi:hypothetical protein